MKIGDKVKVTNPNQGIFYGLTGKIINVRDGYFQIDFGRVLAGAHNCGGLLTRNAGYNVYETDLELVDDSGKPLQEVRSWLEQGLNVVLNGRSEKFAIDTGSYGVTISRDGRKVAIAMTLPEKPKPSKVRLKAAQPVAPEPPIVKVAQ